MKIETEIFLKKRAHKVWNMLYKSPFKRNKNAKVDNRLRYMGFIFMQCLSDVSYCNFCENDAIEKSVLSLFA